MKILRVQFKNLNSLRGDQPHEIDFEREPLRGVSLFAITGPTGAGKSTLLDAITLALYGRAARYGDTPNPEDMMSRHCGECHSSVTFEVAAGRFRAEWHLWRARRKPDGDFQKPRRQLYDADDTPLTQNLREADRLIEQIIGLDYGRFLRSAMLAQGEFTRFLKAGANERAELLECLTGTEIYSELGTLAYAESSRRQAELVQREQVLGAITLLTDNERQERTEHLALRQEEANGAQRERDDLSRRLERVRNLARARDAERELVRQQRELETQRQAAEPDLVRLRAHRRTLLFADALSRLDAANELSITQQGKLTLALAEQARSHLEYRRILAVAADFGDLLVKTQQQRLDAHQQQAKAHEASRKILADWLAVHPHDGVGLEQALPALNQLLNGLVHQRAQRVASQQKAGQLAYYLTAQAQTIQDAQGTLEAARAELATRTDARAREDEAVQMLLSGGTSVGRQAELDALQDRITALRTLATQTGQLLKREERLTADRRLLTEEEAALAAAAHAVADLECQRESAEQQRLLQDDHLQQSRAWQSYEQQRARLQPGNPCPLCGAAEHPWAHGYQPAVSLTQIEKALLETVARLKELDTSLRTARKAQTTADTRRTLLAEGIRRSESELAAATTEIARLAGSLNMADTAFAALQAATTEAAARQEQLRLGLTQLQTAEKRLHDRKLECLQAEHAAQAAAVTEAAAVKRQQELQASIASETETLRRMQTELAVIHTDLTDRLAPFGHLPPESGCEAALAQTLGVQQRFYREQEQAHREVDEALAATRRAGEACAETLAELTRRADGLRATAQETMAPVEHFDAGELCADWRGIEDAANVVRSRQTLMQLAEAAATRQQQGAAETRAAAQALADKLESGLAATDFPTLAELRAARLDEAAAGAFDVREREMQRTASELQGRLEATRAHLKSLCSGESTEEDATTLEPRHAAAETRCRELLTDIGQRQGELTRDDEHRQRHAAGAAALAQARERLVVWTRLQALIGSHDGAKFRRYAQGISLDLLVRRANRHLARLNDRYELRRRPGEELDLDIVDHYQASVTRPLASLSGGESFLSSLALALGLADLAGRNVRIESLFIDEGFGTLDADSLDVAISALDSLRRDRKTVGVISHVELLKERIPTQIVVEKGAGGVSRLVVRS